MGLVGGMKKVADELQCSVFAPFEAAPGDGFLVQAFAHLAEHARLLEGMAKEADRDAVRRGADKLGEVARGQELFFHLNMPGLAVDEPVQSVVWNGDIESVQFAVDVPDGSSRGASTASSRSASRASPSGTSSSSSRSPPRRRPRAPRRP